jgi:hypothetical protein
MAGLVPAIHVFLGFKGTWMPGTRPGMTEEKYQPSSARQLRSSTARKIRSRLFHQITGGMQIVHYHSGLVMCHSTDRR